MSDVPEVPPVAEPVVPAPAGDAPWAADLAGLVTDEAQRAAVDGYLREKWQPRMTQLEQDYAATEDARDLYTRLTNEDDSVATYLATAEQLYGEDVAQAVASALGIEVDPQEPAPVTEPTAPEVNVPPHIQEMYDKFQQDEAEKQYRGELSRVKEAAGDGFDEEDFHPFVVTAQGDFDKAYELYNAWSERVAQKYAPPPAEPEAAPITLGGEGAAGAAPTAVEPKYASLNDAVDDMFNGMKPAPTTVGSI